MSTAATEHSGNWYTRTPLYIRIVAGLVLGVGLGLILRSATPDPANPPAWAGRTIFWLNQTAKLLLQLLTMIAPPLILLAVVRALVTADIRGRQAGRVVFLLLLNTLVAILIGLLVANVLRPGKHAQLGQGETHKTADPVESLLNNIPKSFVGPFGDQPNTIGVILIAVGVGLAVRKLEPRAIESVVSATTIGFDIILVLLHWIVQLVPIVVLAKVAAIIGHDGFAPFKALGWFIVAVLLALLLQAVWYLTRIRLASWVKPLDVLRGTRDALLLAFSTGSSTAAMPVTYQCLKDNVKIRPQSASLGALVGSNFNNDGTALYEAMSALFVAQMIGQDLSLLSQLFVVLTSVVAAVGAAGIPEAGLVTMTLVFNAVGLPVGYIVMLLPVDWFLDRCRTAINVMGDINVSCLVDGKVAPSDTADPNQSAESTPSSSRQAHFSEPVDPGQPQAH